MFYKGEIVLAKIPFSDFSDFKTRPVLIIHSSQEDFLALFITTQFHKDAKKIQLKKDSYIRLDKILFLNKELLLEKIKTLDAELYDDVIFDLLSYQTQFFQKRKIKIINL